MRSDDPNPRHHQRRRPFRRAPPGRYGRCGAARPGRQGARAGFPAAPEAGRRGRGRGPRGGSNGLKRGCARSGDAASEGRPWPLPDRGPSCPLSPGCSKRTSGRSGGPPSVRPGTRRAARRCGAPAIAQSSECTCRSFPCTHPLFPLQALHKKHGGHERPRGARLLGRESSRGTRRLGRRASAWWQGSAS